MRFFAPLTKAEKQGDGTLKVSGIASTETVDSDGEIILASAIAEALPEFFRLGGTGPLREMHQPLAAGRVDEAEIVGKVTYIVATVVDAAAIRKIEQGVYRGFSVGGKVLARDPKNRKVITKVGLYEISLVDRPANPEATFDVWKAAGFEAMADHTLVDEIAKAADAVDALKSQFAKMQTERDDEEFANYIATFANLGRPPTLTKSTFVAERLAAETRADLAKAAEADDLANLLPERRATTYGRVRSCL